MTLIRRGIFIRLATGKDGAIEIGKREEGKRGDDRSEGKRTMGRGRSASKGTY